MRRSEPIFQTQSGDDRLEVLKAMLFATQGESRRTKRSDKLIVPLTLVRTPLPQSFWNERNIFLDQACIENAELLAGRLGKELIESVVNEVCVTQRHSC
jgi:hypothetical protein